MNFIAKTSVNEVAKPAEPEDTAIVGVVKSVRLIGNSCIAVIAVSACQPRLRRAAGCHGAIFSICTGSRRYRQ